MSDTDCFASARDAFDDVVGWLEGAEAAGLNHAEVEDELCTRGREVMRRLFQDHLDLRCERETRTDVIDADGVTHGSVEPDHRRGLGSLFGPVTVSRLACCHTGHPNLHPADASLNLPVEYHSHGVRRLAAVESTRGSFDDARTAIASVTGSAIGKRQVEALTRTAAADVEAFYLSATAPATRRATWWSSRSTARASSCAPTLFARPPPGPRRRRQPSCAPGFPKGEVQPQAHGHRRCCL